MIVKWLPFEYLAKFAKKFVLFAYYFQIEQVRDISLFLICKIWAHLSCPIAYCIFKKRR